MNAAGESSLVVVTNQRLGTSPIFSPMSEVALSGESGVDFVGWLDQLPKRASGGTASWQYTFTGPQRWLLFSTLQQDFQVLEKNEAGETVMANLGNSGLTMLGRLVTPGGEESDPTQGHLSLGAAVDEVLNYAIADVGGFSFARTASLTAQMPWAARQDDKALHALRTLLKWAPATVVRWHGTQLRILTPDYNANVKTLSPQALPLRDEVTITPRYDLLCAETQIVYLRRAGSGGTWTRNVDSDATGGGDAVQKAIITIFLEEGEPVPEPGIAATFQAWAGRLHFSATAPVNKIDWANRPGDVWRPAGSLGFGDDVRMVCQSITRDLFTRAETLEFGPPAQLGLADLIALKRKPRRPDQGAPPTTPEEDAVGTVRVRLFLPEGASGDYLSQISWRVGEQTGNGDLLDGMEMPVGEFRASASPPSNLILDPTQGTPAAGGEVTVVEGATVNVDFHFKWAEEIYLQKSDDGGKWILLSMKEERPAVIIHDDNDGDPREVILDLGDLDALDVPPGKSILKIRKRTVGHMSLPGYVLRLESETWEAEGGGVDLDS